MKKIFSLLATAAFAVCGLSSCGGGGGDDAGYETMSVREFVNGTKVFKLSAVEGQSTLYMTGSGDSSQARLGDDSATNVLFIAGVGGKGYMTERGTCNYTVTRDKESDAITGATLVLAFDDTADNEKIVQVFGFEGNPDNDDDQAAGGGGDAGEEEEEGDEPKSSVVELHLDFAATRWQDSKGNEGVLWVEMR